MKHALLVIATIYSAISCTGKSNLEEQIAAHGVYEKTSKIDDTWLKVTPKDSIKIQSQKSLRVPIKERIWNLTTGKWQEVDLNIHGLLQLFAITKEDQMVWSSCALDTYLVADSVTAARLYIQGNAMTGVRSLKDHTSMRSEISQLNLTDSPHAPELMKLCEANLTAQMIKSVRQKYHSLLITSWLEDSIFSCNHSSDCQAWLSRFPKNWGKGEVSCRKGLDISKNYCGIIAPAASSCPIYLTDRGFMGSPDGESSFLVSNPNRSSLSCSKPGYMCLIKEKNPNGLLESSCLPEIERYLTHTQ